jgi:predicted nucleotidyltransferase
MVNPQYIRQVSAEIASRFHPDRIILFGSHAYGTPTEHSDVDLLVVMPFQGRGTDKAIEIGLALGVTLPMDLIVLTPQRLRRRLQLGDFFLREITERGQVLYDAAHAGVG